MKAFLTPGMPKKAAYVVIFGLIALAASFATLRAPLLDDYRSYDPLDPSYFRFARVQFSSYFMEAGIRVGLMTIHEPSEIC